MASYTDFCTVPETPEEMQVDLDLYLESYNTQRPHRGRKMNGRTPYAVLQAGIHNALKAPPSSPHPEEEDIQAA